MPGPQFIHAQTFSQKANPAGNTVDQAIDEANREPEFSLHVEAPQPPRPIFGDPKTFKADHAAHVAARGTKAMVKGVERVRVIRKDRHTLCTVIASYPLTHDQIAEGGDAAKSHHAEWEKRTLDFMKKKYGGELRVALAHDDEDHPHLHFWILPDNPNADAKLLHPGKAAKVEVEAKAKADGIPDREAVKLGNDALKDAMRGFLDEYFHEVSEPLGMLRDGPKRRRDSREQYKSRLAEAERNAVSLARVAKAEAQTDAAVSELKATHGQQAAVREQIEGERTEAAAFVRKVMSAADEERSEAETEAGQIIDLAKTEAGSIVSKAQDDGDRVRRAAAQDIEKIKATAHAEGFEAGRVAGWYAGFEAAKERIYEYRCTLQTILDSYNGYVSKASKMMGDLRVFSKIRDVARGLSKDGNANIAEIEKVMQSLERSQNNDYIGGVAGVRMKENDAALLSPYREALSEDVHRAGAPVEKSPTKDAGYQSGPGL
jgi:hypothetical protein